MAGLLAWAADVVGGGHGAVDDGDEAGFPAVVFSPEQGARARELDQRAASLRRSIQGLRRRIPPADVAQRLPQLHAHSLASNAALALQLNAHSSTRQLAQLREETLQEENTAYEKAIVACEKKIQEKLQEANLLQNRLKEMDASDKELKGKLETAQTTWEDNQSKATLGDSKDVEKIHLHEKPPKNLLLEKLNEKKTELSTFEAMVQGLEEKWAATQHDSLRQPLPAEREKTLEKQLHSLIEQLTVKQAQAEGLISEIKLKEQELEKLIILRRKLEFGSTEESTARNRFGRSSRAEAAHMDHTMGTHNRLSNGSRAENLQKLVLLRSAFVLYILVLHVLVFIKISF